jgi:UDP-N-acetylmuramoyl-tripeptide--D-alanyl-D-alanine ligase
LKTGIPPRKPTNRCAANDFKRRGGYAWLYPLTMNIQALHTEFLRSSGICTDTRQEVKGRIFFALRGDRFDGNIYVEDAIKRGCLLAVTDRIDLEGMKGIVRVDSPLEMLQQLARFHRLQLPIKILAITGSNGKTTTKELTASILSRRFRCRATTGNLNNHIGVPLTLLSLREEEIGVVEMGANHPGEIAALSVIAVPDIGLITNIGKAHLEGFGSVEGVLRSKGELFDYLSARGGKALVDGEDAVLMEKAEQAGVERLVIRGEVSAGNDRIEPVGTGEGKMQGVIPVGCRITAQVPYLEVELMVGNDVFQITTSLVGAYNLKNILYASAAGYYFGVPAGEIAAAIESYVPVNQRSQFIKGQRNRVVLDAYNANPTSMRESISGILDWASPPVMLILGDMAEMGESARDEHWELVNWLKSFPVDKILLVGENFWANAEPSDDMRVFRRKEELAGYLESEKPSDFHVLVKGSRIMALETLLEYL